MHVCWGAGEAADSLAHPHAHVLLLLVLLPPPSPDRARPPPYSVNEHARLYLEGADVTSGLSDETINCWSRSVSVWQTLHRCADQTGTRLTHAPHTKVSMLSPLFGLFFFHLALARICWIFFHWKQISCVA